MQATQALEAVGDHARIISNCGEHGDSALGHVLKLSEREYLCNGKTRNRNHLEDSWVVSDREQPPCSQNQPGEITDYLTSFYSVEAFVVGAAP